MTARRVVGAALLVGAYVPLHRLLDPARTGPAGAATRGSAESAWAAGLYGSVLVLGTAFVCARVVTTAPLRSLLARAGRALERPSIGAFALVAGLTAAAVAALIARFLYGGLPTSVDEMVQLLHARAVAEGMVAIPVPGAEAAWTIQNGKVTPAGWASIYPPFHTLLLAAGLTAGTAWFVGPAAIGVATMAMAHSFERLLGNRLGRASAAVLAVAPFWLLLGGTYQSHTTAAACLAVVLWAGLRAQTGGSAWAAVAGAALGAAVCTRPLTGLVSSSTLLAVLWWPRGSDRPGRSRLLLRRLVATGVGGLPFAALLFWWNARLFGSPLRLGYADTFGPAHGLGFHVDPWGNVYGAVEALAYTGADLVQLGTHLLNTPFPAVALVGGGLLLRRPRGGTGPLLAWALATLGANALYWHHGFHLGPRMLYESAPAWIGLVVAACAVLMNDSVDSGRSRTVAGVAAWATVVSASGALLLAPGLIRSATAGPDMRALATLPSPPVPGPALVFVHGSWSSRLSARLSAAGMRRDSVETALRRNDICAVDRYARWRASGESVRARVPPPLDLTALPGRSPGLEALQLSPGNVVSVSPGSVPDAACLREARADRLGTVELEPLLWQAPPLPRQEVVTARDLGPAANASVRQALRRTAYVYVIPGEGGAGRLLGYDEGMDLLWGEVTATAGGGAAPR